MCNGKCDCKIAIEAKEKRIKELLDTLNTDLSSHEFEAIKSEILRLMDDK